MLAEFPLGPLAMVFDGVGLDSCFSATISPVTAVSRAPNAVMTPGRVPHPLCSFVSSDMDLYLLDQIYTQVVEVQHSHTNLRHIDPLSIFLLCENLVNVLSALVLEQNAIPTPAGSQPVGSQCSSVAAIWGLYDWSMARRTTGTGCADAHSARRMCYSGCTFSW